MGAIISKISIKNFRSIEKQLIILRERNIIVGKNNAGKSTLLSALNYALSFLTIEKEDVYTSLDDPYSENKKVIIDILINPYNDSKVDSNFNDKWTNALGSAIQFDSKGNSYAGIRSVFDFDSDRKRYNHKKFFITAWSDEIDDVRINNNFSRELFDNLIAIYLDAQRDISKDINDKKSLWSRLTSEVKIDDDNKKIIEEQIKEINSSIIEQSVTLRNIKNELSNSAAESRNTIELDSITRDIESLYKGMNIFYSGENQSPIPVDKVGLGVRSWAVFSTIKALNKMNYEMSHEIDEAYLPVFLIEEPEAHIHPQAQRTLLKNIIDLKGQIFITTHSNYIFSDVDYEDIIYVRMENAQSVFTSISFDGLSIGEDELRSIKRTFMKLHSDLLYCNAVVLFEGETEEYAFPVYFKKYTTYEDYEKGVNFVPVLGSGERYLAYIRILKALNIPWFIYSDGEKDVVKKLNRTLVRLGYSGRTKHEDFENVFVIPNKKSYEEYLISLGNSGIIETAINDYEKQHNNQNNFVSDYMKKMHGQKRKKNQPVRDYKGKSGKEFAVLDILKEGKTKYAEVVAQKIANNKIPELIESLLKSIEEAYGDKYES